MRTRENKKGAGRPEKEFSQQIFEGLCRIQCRLAEITGVMGLSEDTIERRCKQLYQKTFRDAFEVFAAGGKMSLRRYQFKMAETNPTMAIWLGKQYLEQSDKAELNATVTHREFEVEIGGNSATESEPEFVN